MRGVRVEGRRVGLCEGSEGGGEEGEAVQEGVTKRVTGRVKVEGV